MALCLLSGKKFSSLKDRTEFKPTGNYLKPYKKVVTKRGTDLDTSIRSFLSGLGNNPKREAYSEKFESEFFICKVHKSGTIHLWFKDKDLLDKFNLTAAEGRGWLRPKEEKKRRNYKGAW